MEITKEKQGDVIIPREMCKGCIRNVRNLRMHDNPMIGSPYQQKIYAAKCPEGSCIYDKK